MNSNEIEKEAHKIVMATTLYGSPKAEIGSSARSYYETELRCVILGINHQQEKSYSDEEVLDLITKYIEDNLDPQTHGTIENIKEWFEPLKKLKL